MKDHELPRHISDLVTEASDADSYEERLAPIRRICRSLHANPLLMEEFCEHYLLHYADEMEINTALLVLRRMVNELDLPIVRIMRKAIVSRRNAMSYKYDTISILSLMINGTPIRVYQHIMQLPSLGIKTCMHDGVIGNIHLVMCLEKSFKLIKLCLRISSQTSKRVRILLLDSFITFDHRFSDRRSKIYEYCLNKVKLPHHKVLLYLGLMVSSPERARAYENDVPKWASSSSLVRRYLRDYEEIRED